MCFCLGQFLISRSNNLLFSKTITSPVPQLNYLRLKGHPLVTIRYITQPVFHLAFYSIPCDGSIPNSGTAAKAYCAPSPAGRSKSLEYLKIQPAMFSWRTSFDTKPNTCDKA